MGKATLDFTRTDGAKKRLPTRAQMRAWIEKASERKVALSICFVDESQSQKLNFKYRKKRRPTNVLTFDYAHEPVAEADIVVCTPVIEKEAKEQGKSFKEHLAHMLIHATLHAQGWDHATDEEAEAMEAKESRLMKKLGFADPYSDRARAH